MFCGLGQRLAIAFPNYIQWQFLGSATLCAHYVTSPTRASSANRRRSILVALNTSS